MHNVCVQSEDPYVTLTSKQADRAMEEYIRLTEKYGGTQRSKPRMGKKQLPAFKDEGYEPDIDGEDFDYPSVLKKVPQAALHALVRPWLVTPKHLPLSLRNHNGSFCRARV